MKQLRVKSEADIAQELDAIRAARVEAAAAAAALPGPAPRRTFFVVVKGKRPGIYYSL